MHHCKTYSIILLVSCLSFLRLSAQEDSLVRQTDSLTQVKTDTMNAWVDELTRSYTDVNNNSIEAISYQLYLNQQWAELADYCEKAINIKVDYYYLRVRAGVAYFEMKRYRRAGMHFKKALQFNAGDDFATSSLYYCYVYTDRFEEAKNLTRSFSPTLAETIGTKAISPIDFITLENGFKTADSSNLYKNPLFSSLGLSHSINRRVFLFHSFTYYGQNEARFNVNQFQYYLKAGIPLKNDFTLAAGLHLINVNADVRSYVRTVTTSTYQLNEQPGQPQQSPQTGTTSTTTYVEQLTPKQTLSYIGAATLTKHTSFFDLSLGAIVARFDTTSQLQANAGILFYPLKNNRLAFGSYVYMHTEQTFSKSYLAFAPVITTYLSKKIHLALRYFNNRGPNITENTGYFVSNSTDYTTQRLSLTASVKIAGNLWLYGTYGYEQKKHFTESFRYSYQVFLIGFKIIPQFK